MRALAWTFLLCALAIVGCGDNRRITNPDTGPPPPRDAGCGAPICLMDSGTPPPFDSGMMCIPGTETNVTACTDARDNDCDLQVDCNDFDCCSFLSCAPGTTCGNMMRDAGTPPRDSGPPFCGTISAATMGFLPGTCMPRCSSATLAQVQACTTAACANTANMNDRTPSVTVMGATMAYVVNCAECYGYQLLTCQFMACPTQMQALFDCLDVDPTGASCTMQDAAASSCLMASTSLTTCYNNNVLGLGAGVGCYP